MAIRKSTRIWLVLFVASLVAVIALAPAGSSDSGCGRLIAINLAILSGLVLLYRGIVALFRQIIRKLTLRLAFSYFLIGIVPIPLLLLLLFSGAYLLAHQIVATRVHRELVAAGREASSSPATGLPSLRVDEKGQVTNSGVAWLPAGSSAAWAMTLKSPRSLIAGEEGWLAVPDPEAGNRRVLLILLTDPGKTWARRLTEATGYDVIIEVGTSHRGRGFNVDFSRDPAVERRAPPAGGEKKNAASPGSPAPDRSWLDRKWIAGVYVDRPVATLARAPGGRNVVLYIGRTSPRILGEQLFAQGAPEVGRVFWAIFTGIAFALLVVYLAALATAFVLVGTITRNVNRLTRASQAIARGEFSVRLNSRSKNQIGDLARSFDGMAASIEGLLVETAKKERLEGEIAIARTLQQKLLPPPGATLPGLSLLARFEPLAEIGGDYYDYATLPDGRNVVAIGDVSGHGLSTGLLVAMAKAGLSTLLESGLDGTPLFIKLNELIHRSTDSRNYMTLALLACDPVTREATLTNAGQLAPYRLSSGAVDSLSLPSFPLGISPRRDFPTKSFQLATGDRLVFLTDGIVEAASPSGEPFGFERLEDLLRVEVDSDPARLQGAILAAVAEHAAGRPAEDDRTLVVVKVEEVKLRVES
ncbi:MAG: SpoIIE family protein phosphatase [Acidobacteria bacterium]|nr:SpoIIE family protein phosphatase [Acidobacteriota bacterium]MCA1610003.1 SpoIIE family protein phosphatase [Acidobacteriota bacterium]